MAANKWQLPSPATPTVVLSTELNGLANNASVVQSGTFATTGQRFCLLE